MKRSWALLGISLCLPVAMLCSQPVRASSSLPDQEEILPQDPMSMVPYELWERLHALQQAGATQAERQLLLSWHEAFLDQQISYFNMLLNNLLATDELVSAEDLCQRLQGQADRLLREYYFMLQRYYNDQEDKQALLDWCVGLQERNLPADMRLDAFRWLLDARRQVGPAALVAELARECVATFDAPTGIGLMSAVLDAYRDAGDIEAANQVLDAIDSASQESEWRQWVICQRLYLLQAAANWSAAAAHFQNNAPALPDASLAACLRRVSAEARRLEQFDYLDGICQWVFDKQKQKPAAWQAAANAWLASAGAREAASEIVLRLKRLEELDCAPTVLARLFSQYDCLVMQTSQTNLIEAMASFGDRLAPRLPDAEERGYLLFSVAEHYFLLEDYERSLQIMDQPLPHLSSEQRDVFVNKIKAHLALQKGDKKEAIEHFRAFMQSVEGWEQAQIHPFTGQLFTKEMCLGFNAKRIGDILASMAETAGARAAYQEAADYYAAALQKFEADAPESQQIQEQQAALAELLKQ